MVQNRNSYYNQMKGVPTNELVPIKQSIERLDEKVTNVEAKVDELSNQVITECVIADNVTVNQKLTADNIETDTVKSNTFTGNSAEIDTIDATKVEADEVKATDASFSNLTVANKVNELSVGTLHTDTFSPTNISTNTVTADTVTTDTVNSDNVVTEKLQVTDKATIDNADIETATVMNGDIHSLSSDTITVREITADKATVTEVDADIVKSTVAEFTRSTIDSIKTNTISTNGKLNADPQGETHYSIDVPNYDNALVQLSGVYSTNDKWSVNILKARNTAYISASETTLDGILDISYDEGKLRLRVKSDGIVNYSLYVNEENPAPLTISPLGDHYMPYYYVPEKLNTYTLLGYDDTTSQFYIPGTLKVYQLTAEYVSYERLAVVELRADRLELPKTHDSGGGVSEYSYGNARDYVSVSDDELVNEYHTPIEHATNGALSNSTCLIAESAITEYDGTKTVENVTTYPITHLGDSSTVHGKLAVEDDTVIDGTVAIKGDLWVDGTTHTVDEEEVVSQADTITLRANNSSSLGSNLSGLVINKYNGTDDLGIVADSDGTLRVGTGTGTETCYPTISYDFENNKWYTDPEDVTTEVTPVGNLTSWASKEKAEPFTTYTDAVFTLFDKTTLEPVMTRDESVDMTDGQIVCWDSTGNKAKTTNCISDNVTFAKCVDVECNLNVDGSICACCNVDTPTVNADCVNACCCITTCNATFCDSVTICCDLRVCGSAIIHGLTSDCVAVQENTCDHAMYPTFVCRNNAQQQGELMFTDYDLNYNPFTNTLYSPNIEFTNAHGNNVTADIAVTTCQAIVNRIMSPNCPGVDTSVEFYQHQNNDTYRKIACLECNTFKYEPLYCNDCCGKIQFMMSGNATFVDQCNYVNNGCLHTCAVIAIDDCSCFCGIETKYDINMYEDDWNCRTGYIYCNGTGCWNGPWSFCGGINANTANITTLSFGWCGGLTSLYDGYQPTWGNQTGTAIASWNDCTGGSMSFRRDNPIGGQLSMIIDGTVYVDEGRYPVIHSGNIGSQTVDKAVCLTDGTAAFKAEYGNEYNMYNSDGTWGWINYRGGINTVRLGNGADNAGLGTLVAGAIIDSGHVSACHNNAYGYTWSEGHGAAFTVWNDYVNCPAGNSYVSALSQLSANGGWFSLGVLSGYDCWGITHSGGSFITTVSGSGDIWANGNVTTQGIFCSNCCTGLVLCGNLGGSVWLGQSSIAIGNPVSWSGSNTYVTAIGYNAKADSSYSTAVGGCARACGNYTTALGWNSFAYADEAIAIGHDSNASAACSIAIGCNAVVGSPNGIAIGNQATAYCYGSSVTVDMNIRAYHTRLVTVSWRSGAMQCDIFNAISSNMDLTWVGGEGIPEDAVNLGVIGAFSHFEINRLRFDKNESPRNIDFIHNGNDIFCTVCDGNTSTVDRPGMVTILGSR